MLYGGKPKGTPTAAHQAYSGGNLGNTLNGIISGGVKFKEFADFWRGVFVYFNCSALWVIKVA